MAASPAYIRQQFYTVLELEDGDLASSVAANSTTSTLYSQVGTVNSIPAGTWLILVYALSINSTTSVDHNIQVRFGTGRPSTIPVISLNPVKFRSLDINDRIPFFFMYSVTTSATATLRVFHSSSTSGVNVTLSSVQMLVMRQNNFGSPQDAENQASFPGPITTTTSGFVAKTETVSFVDLTKYLLMMSSNYTNTGSNKISKIIHRSSTLGEAMMESRHLFNLNDRHRSMFGVRVRPQTQAFQVWDIWHEAINGTCSTGDTCIWRSRVYSDYENDGSTDRTIVVKGDVALKGDIQLGDA